MRSLRVARATKVVHGSIVGSCNGGLSFQGKGRGVRDSPISFETPCLTSPRSVVSGGSVINYLRRVPDASQAHAHKHIYKHTEHMTIRTCSQHWETLGSLVYKHFQETSVTSYRCLLPA